MKQLINVAIVSTVLLLVGPTVQAADLTIRVVGSDPIAQHNAKFKCDEHAASIGLPSGVFSVQYFNGNGNSLAVLPISGRSLIFSNVLSASGARYAAGSYIWWDAGDRGVHLYSDALSGKNQTACRQVK